MIRLPPLPALVAFEAAARSGSFLAAAEELHLTPSAISHRIRALEDWLGLPLFERHNRLVTLTTAGADYLAEVRAALRRLETASTRLRRVETRPLRLSVAPAIGAKWLVGQLADYPQEDPRIDFVLSTSTSLAPLTAGEADVGLRYGDPPWPGLEAYELRRETVFPVCSPALAARLAQPADLDGQRLLRHPLLAWSPWFAAAGLVRPEPAEGALFEDSMMMLEAAAAGAGIALTVSLLAKPYLGAGTLVKPFDIEVADKGFYAVVSPAAQTLPWVRHFVRWLQARARSSPA